MIAAGFEQRLSATGEKKGKLGGRQKVKGKSAAGE